MGGAGSDAGAKLSGSAASSPASLLFSGNWRSSLEVKRRRNTHRNMLVMQSHAGSPSQSNSSRYLET